MHGDRNTSDSHRSFRAFGIRRDSLLTDYGARRTIKDGNFWIKYRKDKHNNTTVAQMMSTHIDDIKGAGDDDEGICIGSDILGGEPRNDPCEGGVAATAVYSTVPSSPSGGLGAFPPEVMGKLMVTLKTFHCLLHF